LLPAAGTDSTAKSKLIKSGVTLRKGLVEVLKMARRALVTGASGQDGSYLVELLVAQGYAVHAQSRRAALATPDDASVQWHQVELGDAGAIDALVAAVVPDEIYNLASVSRPIESWAIPAETFTANALLPLYLCEAVRKQKLACRIFQASSSEIFGDTKVTPQDETTPCLPQTPYGLAKLSAHQVIGMYRRNHGIFACSGILFNHESPRRPLSYVSQKIAHAAAAVSLGLQDTGEKDERGWPILSNGLVQLGNLEVRRDFGFAGDYVAAMQLMLQAQSADDYVIGTGQAHSIQELCEAAFGHVGLDWRKHVRLDNALVRKIDSHFTVANPAKAEARLGWRARTSFANLIAMMVDARRALIKKSHTAPALAPNN
jgi:GDPmannose 4,6-dehydratase